MRDYPKWRMLKQTNSRVEVLGAGHFESTLKVKAKDGSIFEVDASELKDDEETEKTKSS